MRVELLHKETLAEGSEFPVRLFRVSLPTGRRLGVNAALGGKIKLFSNRLRKPRSYTPISPPSATGHFELAIKIYRGGVASSYIDSLAVGDALTISIPTPRLKRITRVEGASHVGLVALGIGITEAYMVALAELECDDVSLVFLLFVNRTRADAVFADRLAHLKGKYGDRFRVQYAYSRDPGVYGAVDGRVSEEMLAAVFEGWPKDGKSRFLVVGTKRMKKAVWTMLAGCGWARSISMLHAKRHCI